MNMQRNLFLKFVLLAAILQFVISCTASAPQEETANNSPLIVAYTQWWGDYTLLVAKEKGFFEKYGIEVEPVYYDVFARTFSDLAAGQIDGAMIAVGDTLSVDHSAKMKVVGVSDDGGADAIIGGPGINSIEDLKGKKVGVLLGSQYELMVTLMLQSANINMDDITLTGIDPENASNALRMNQVQAVYTWEPFLSEAVSNGSNILYPKEKTRLFPDMIVFNALIVKDRPEDVRAFLKAWFEAVDYRLLNPEETQAIAAKYLNVDINDIPVDDNLKILSLDENKSMFNPKGENSVFTTLRLTSDYLISIGALAQQINPLELLDPSYLP
ncbi:MAG: ABC transporter substrate-binding protein [Chloroflexi bacterium]|nr:ABC transporter substrate-binding protein [Chloroflexota bacterium]